MWCARGSANASHLDNTAFHRFLEHVSERSLAHAHTHTRAEDLRVAWSALLRRLLMFGRNATGVQSTGRPTGEGHD